MNKTDDHPEQSVSMMSSEAGISIDGHQSNTRESTAQLRGCQLVFQIINLKGGLVLSRPMDDYSCRRLGTVCHSSIGPHTEENRSADIYKISNTA